MYTKSSVSGKSGAGPSETREHGWSQLSCVGRRAAGPEGAGEKEKPDLERAAPLRGQEDERLGLDVGAWHRATC